MNISRVIALLSCILISGCQTPEKDLTGFNIYIESWDRISFSNPYYGNWFVSKPEATEFIREKKNTIASKAYVVLGKNIHMHQDTLEERMDEIQSWLISEGIEHIIFELALSFDAPCIVREHHKEK